ncbi:endonuclease domain-containing protein [Robertkochia flava]|uniref:endonuclease domain-containing protein n=1 Tax=Robertkochia flava TaxID=3447986 RepID=UPI001CCA9C52|nr:endonuclease domain-containing protein [Robertkochia marina]
MGIHNRKESEIRRKQLRSKMTNAEWVLWHHLRKKQLQGRRFRRQHSIGPYIVDFYCPTEKLIIEVDGGVHLAPEQIRKDEQRSRYFKANGYYVLRFSNNEIFKIIPEVLLKIETSFNQRKT